IFVRSRGSAFSGVCAVLSLLCSLSTASLVGSSTQSRRRSTTIGSITSRYCGGRYGPRSRLAISQILSVISLWRSVSKLLLRNGDAVFSWRCQLHSFVAYRVYRMRVCEVQFRPDLMPHDSLCASLTKRGLGDKSGAPHLHLTDPPWCPSGLFRATATCILILWAPLEVFSSKP